jgi:hypothetical protein
MINNAFMEVVRYDIERLVKWSEKHRVTLGSPSALTAQVRKEQVN